MSSSDASGPPRQRVERLPGSRRARLTPVPGTDATPDGAGGDDDPDGPADPQGGGAASGSRGPNDDRLRQDVPPHY